MREYLEVLGVIAVATLAGWFAPVTYHVLGHVYLLVVILLCLRVGRGPVLFAAVVSALVWNYVFMPPRLSLHLLDVDDGMLLGIYFVVALIAGQFTARIRASERMERGREKRATALFHLTRALAGANSLEEAVRAALVQAAQLFHAQTALLLTDEAGNLRLHAASRFDPDPSGRILSSWVLQHGREAGRFTREAGSADALYVPLLRASRTLGVFALRWPQTAIEPDAAQRDLIEGFAAQIALLVEREQLRIASEREKLFAESDRLHRTLLDSVSHELKTPLAVLRSAGEKIDTDDGGKRGALTAEIRTATRRLENLVANLLNQTRLESGGLTPQLDWCDARDVINAARRSVGGALAGRELRVAVPSDLPLFRADPVLMEHVVANLLLNAGLHTPPGTAVELGAALDRSGPAPRFSLWVSDGGAGLSVELRATLFQKFRRGADARAGGLGLGLSIVRGFVLARGRRPPAGAGRRRWD